MNGLARRADAPMRANALEAWLMTVNGAANHIAQSVALKCLDGLQTKVQMAEAKVEERRVGARAPNGSGTCDNQNLSRMAC